jgi:hypothetical protein
MVARTLLIKADKKPTEKTTLAEATTKKKKKLPEEKKLRAEKKFPTSGLKHSHTIFLQ